MKKYICYITAAVFLFNPFAEIPWLLARRFLLREGALAFRPGGSTAAFIDVSQADVAYLRPVAAGEREEERIIKEYTLGRWQISDHARIFSDEHFMKVPNPFRRKEKFAIKQSTITRRFDLGSLMPTGGDFSNREDLIYFVCDEIRKNLRQHARKDHGYYVSMTVQLIKRAKRQGIRIISENEFPEIHFDKIMQGKTIRRMGLDVGGAFLLMMSQIAYSNEGIEIVFESSGYGTNDYIREISQSQDQLLTPEGRRGKPPISRISITIFEKLASATSIISQSATPPNAANRQLYSSILRPRAFGEGMSRDFILPLTPRFRGGKPCPLPRGGRGRKGQNSHRPLIFLAILIRVCYF